MIRDRATLIIEDDGKIIIVRHIFNFKFGLPGGGRKFKESFEKTARREIEEEFGAKLIFLKYLFDYNFGLHRHKVFLARIKGKIKLNWEIRKLIFASSKEIEKLNLSFYARNILKKFLSE